MSGLIIYENQSHGLEIRLEGETLWLNMGQMAELFGVNKPAISKHLSNIYSSKELSRAATISTMETVQQEGGRTVRRSTDHYNLDAVISVGYRVNSGQATRFRIWATGVLKDHLTQGWTLNRQRFEENARELETALKLVRKTAQHPELNLDEGRGLVEILSRYTQTFLLLQQYDEGLLTDPAGQRGGSLPGAAEARKNIAVLKGDLIRRQEATELFAQEREEGLAAILGNLEQTVMGEPAYPTVESKAAHLLYFTIKNHPFADGNKRTAAFLFVDFLHRNQRLHDATGQAVINAMGLAALTLLIAESDPAEKEIMIRLTMNMLAREVA